MPAKNFRFQLLPIHQLDVDSSPGVSRAETISLRAISDYIKIDSQRRISQRTWSWSQISRKLVSNTY